MQAFVINFAIGNARDHLHLVHFQRRAVDPARCFTQAFADFRLLALEQEDFTCRRWQFGLHTLDTTAMSHRQVHTPFFHEVLGVQGC